MAFTGAILDFDGTLVDSLDAWRDLERVLLKESDVSVTLEDRAQFTTFTLDETARWFHENGGLGKSVADVRQIMDDYMVAYLSRSTRVLPGVRSFLESCAQQGIKMSVASSSPQLYLRTALEATDLVSYFTQVLSVEDIGGSKRESRIFDIARESMGTDKEATWGFDDSLYALRVLRNAGYPTVGIYDPHEQIPFDSWKDLVTIVVRSFEELSVDRLNA